MTALYILNSSAAIISSSFGMCLEHRRNTYLQMKSILLAARMWSADFYDFIYVAREQGT
jgi:hypothetical protein